ncbi:MAG: FHA domain-containing protein [Bifidobacterium sp.]|nr:FHA domain-containing protein [Bifidobacterium sp.]
MQKLPFPPPPEPGWCDDDTALSVDAPKDATPQHASYAAGTTATAAHATQGSVASGAHAAATDQPQAASLSGSGAAQAAAPIAAAVVHGAHASHAAHAAHEATNTHETLSMQAVEAAGGAAPAPGGDRHEGEPLEYAARPGADGDQWDGTVLSATFMPQGTQHPTYHMVNDVTGQEFIVDMGVLIGRKPSQDIPEGAKAVRLIDPTRTVSRNHAAIGFDRDGQLWVEDYGSLNGTYIVDATGEHQVFKGARKRLTPPCHLRIGDQMFTFEEKPESPTEES